MEGIAKICGLQLLAEDGSDLAKIDLCEGLGTWRTQTLQKDEYIIGYHYYIQSDEEEINNESILAAPIEEDSEWLDSFGFIVCKFIVNEPVKAPTRPRGRPRVRPLP